MKTIILVILGIFFTFSPIVTSDLNFKNSGYNSETNFEDKNLQISTISGKIHINNNWSATEAAGICTGNGTYSDPYIIEDLVIDGGGSGSCILIENSIVYFRIENCTVYNSGDYPCAGIQLSNVINGLVINSTCSSNYMGIFLVNSNYNNVSGNTANNNVRAGIDLVNSNYNNVSGNTANNNVRAGIYLVNSNYNNVSGNTANYNTYGISLYLSNYNTISRNTTDNQYGNSAVDSGCGIALQFNSNNNTISGNIANHNVNEGIGIYRSYNNIVLRNTLFYNDNNGIGVHGGDNNVISENSANYNSIGIRLLNDYGIKVYNNLISGNNVTNNNYFGIYLRNCYDHLILGNNASNNIWDGINLRESDNNTISGNVANFNNGSGIYLKNSDYNIVSGNILIGNDECIVEENCQGNKFSDNGSCAYGQEDGRDPNELIIIISVISGGALIGVATLLLIIRKKKRIVTKKS